MIFSDECAIILCQFFANFFDKNVIPVSITAFDFANDEKIKWKMSVGVNVYFSRISYNWNFIWWKSSLNKWKFLLFKLVFFWFKIISKTMFVKYDFTYATIRKKTGFLFCDKSKTVLISLQYSILMFEIFFKKNSSKRAFRNLMNKCFE